MLARSGLSKIGTENLQMQNNALFWIMKAEDSSSRRLNYYAFMQRSLVEICSRTVLVSSTYALMKMALQSSSDCSSRTSGRCSTMQEEEEEEGPR